MCVVINWVRFANGMPRFQEQPTRRQGTEVYDLNIIKIIKFVVVFHTVVRQKRVLVTCEDGFFVFFCSGSQCSGCLTDVKFFPVFAIYFIQDTSSEVLIEFVLRFLQDRTNRLDRFMSNIYVELSQSSCNLLEIPWKYGKVRKLLWLCGWLFCGWFYALGGLVLWQLSFKNWSV